VLHRRWRHETRIWIVQTALISQGKTITSSAVCHDSKTKKSTRHSFFNFQENLMKVNEYLPNLDVEAPVWLDALEHFYRPWQMARREKIPPTWRTSVDDVIAWRHCKSSIQSISQPHCSGQVCNNFERNILIAIAFPCKSLVLNRVTKRSLHRGIKSNQKLPCSNRLLAYKKLAPSYFYQGHAGPGYRTESRSAGPVLQPPNGTSSRGPAGVGLIHSWPYPHHRHI
jgi:hypothetical protein